MHVGTKGASKFHSFGFHRAEVLGAMISLMLFTILLLILFVNAITRMLYPDPDLNSSVMLSIAIFSLVCNLICINIIHGAHPEHHTRNYSHYKGQKKENIAFTQNSINKHSDNCDHQPSHSGPREDHPVTDSEYTDTIITPTPSG